MGAVRHTQRTRARLLANFADTGRIDLAAAAAGVSRDMHYEWLKKFPDYAKAFNVARERASDMLEAEAWRRAKVGIDKPLVHAGRRVVESFDVPKLDAAGQPTGETERVDRPILMREYSDQLLMFLLKGRRREVYGDKLEATGKDGSPLFPVEAVRAYMETVPDDAE